MLRPGVLRLFYDNKQISETFDPNDLRIARWENETWNILPHQLDPDRFAISTNTDRFGIYALLVPAPEETPPAIYLPMLQKP